MIASNLTVNGVGRFLNTIYGNIAGAAGRLDGFSSGGAASSCSWGNQTGTAIYVSGTPAGGGWAFRDNNPGSGQVSMLVDGTVYIKEGGVNVGDAVKSFSVSGKTVTYTTLWGNTGTFTTQDTTYTSQAAASGGTAVSLVTTGEKYTWNNKSNLTIGTTATTAAAGNHTHNYAGSSSAGGAANSLVNFKVTTTSNNAIDTPGSNAIAYASGLTKANWNYQQPDGSYYCQWYNANWWHEIFGDQRTGQISVRGNNNGTITNWRRVLDEINYTSIISLNNCSGLTKSQVTTALGYTPPTTDTNTWRPVGTGATDAAAGNHTHGLSLATDTGTSSISLAANTKYKLTAGGSTYIFTTPPDNNTTYQAGTGLALSGNTFSLSNTGVTAGTKGPTGGVTGTNNTTIYVPQITVDAQGRVTALTHYKLTNKDTTYSSKGEVEDGTAVSLVLTGDKYRWNHGISDILADLATVEATSTASKGYAVGDYLLKNQLLYKVTATISKGDTITSGTNVELVTVGDELSGLNTSTISGTGTNTSQIAANSSWTTHVSFPRTFTSIPHVFVALNNTGTVQFRGAATAYNVSTSGFDLRIDNMGTAALVTGYRYSWIAIGAPNNIPTGITTDAWSHQTIANGRAGITIGNTTWREMIASVVFGKNPNFGFTFHVLREQIQLEKNSSGIHHYIQGSYISSTDNHMCAIQVSETSVKLSYYKYCGADVNEACQLTVFVR